MNGKRLTVTLCHIVHIFPFTAVTNRVGRPFENASFVIKNMTLLPLIHSKCEMGVGCSNFMPPFTPVSNLDSPINLTHFLECVKKQENLKTSDTVLDQHANSGQKGLS